MNEKEPAASEIPVTVRLAKAGDLDRVIALDAKITGLAKPEYWGDLFTRFRRRRRDRYFLVAEAETRMLGFIMGEVRAWEFGSPPCGWVFAVNVEPDARLGGVATTLYEAIREKFQRAGVAKIRTMLARDNTVILSFFRSQGMMAGPYIQLEADLD